MVKFTTAVFVAALVAGPVLSLPLSHDQDLVGREVAEAEIHARDLSAELNTLFGRDVDIADLSEREIEELAERSPFFGKIFRGIKRVAGGIFGRDVDELDELTARDVEELAEVYGREPFFGKIFRGIKRVAGGIFGRDVSELDEITARDLEEFDELVQREPFFGKIFRGIKRVAGGIFGRDLVDAEDLTARDLEELNELYRREPIFRKIFGGVRRIAGGIFGRDIDIDDEITARDFEELNDLVGRADLEELFEREPLRFGGLGAPGRFRFPFRRPAPQVSERDLEMEDLDDLAAREPFKFSGLRRPAGLLTGGIRHRLPFMRQGTGSRPQLSERDLEIEDLDDLAAREPFKFGGLRRPAGLLTGIRQRIPFRRPSTPQLSERDMEIDELD